MIDLRELREDDAENMLEWMHDPECQRGFQKDMMSISLEEARRFCREARLTADLQNGQSMHWAVIDETDEYLGTISLKKINMDCHSAEFAISLRQKAHGRGVGVEAIRLLLKKGFEELGLHRIYMTVLADNIAAIRLYEKCGFIYEGELRDHIFARGHYISWKIYAMLDREYKNNTFMRGES